MSEPLTPAGKLDRDTWLKHRQDSVFRRFWGGAEEHGQLHHRHHGWMLSFTPDDEDDEVIFRAHCRREGYAPIGFGECRARITG